MKPRNAYTLIELLVVLAIIAVLIGLLLPAVQKARAAARRVECASKMREMSLATLGYHDIHNRFPASFQRDLVPGGQYHLSWLARLLPLLGESNTWVQIELDYAGNPIPFRIPVHRSIDRLVPHFYCPGDPVSATVWQIGSGGPGSVRVAFTSYLGNLGTSWRDQSGVIVLGSTVTIASITDGTSQTLLLIERVPSQDRYFGWWYTAEGQKRTGSLDFVMGVRELNGLANKYPRYRGCPPGPYGFRAWDVNDPCSLFSVGGNHSGGSNFAFCDGSVRFLSYSADPIMPALATRAGGEVVAIPE